MPSEQVDLEMRDPNDLNSHIKVCFEDVLAEPEGIRSMDCVWKLSYTCFEFGKGCLYKTMTALCGCCIALGWGCNFACVAFDHVWCWTPCLRDFSICLGCAQRVFGTVVNCCISPVCEACGMCLSKIKVVKG